MPAIKLKQSTTKLEFHPRQIFQLSGQWAVWRNAMDLTLHTWPAAACSLHASIKVYYNNSLHC